MDSTTGDHANSIVQFVASNWLSIVFGIVGLVGSIYTYLSWRAGQREKKAYRYLFELAEKNIARDISEQQLAERRVAIAEASRRIEALQEKIRREIPLAAKRAVLMDRLRSQTEILQQHYESVLALRSELQAVGATADIPGELLRAVERHIEPDYFVREKRSRFKTNLSILTAGSAVASAALPSPAGRFVSLALLVLTVPVLVALARLAVREHERTNTAARGRWLAAAGIAAGVIAFAFAVGLLLLAVVEPRSTGITAPFGIVLLVCSTVFIVLAMRKRTQLKLSLDRARPASGETPRSGEAAEGQSAI